MKQLELNFDNSTTAVLEELADPFHDALSLINDDIDIALSSGDTQRASELIEIKLAYTQ